jgi:hypothetical protein
LSIDVLPQEDVENINDNVNAANVTDVNNNTNNENENDLWSVKNDKTSVKYFQHVFDLIEKHVSNYYSITISNLVYSI